VLVDATLWLWVALQANLADRQSRIELLLAVRPGHDDRRAGVERRGAGVDRGRCRAARFVDLRGRRACGRSARLNAERDEKSPAVGLGSALRPHLELLVG